MPSKPRRRAFHPPGRVEPGLALPGHAERGDGDVRPVRRGPPAARARGRSVRRADGCSQNSRRHCARRKPPNEWSEPSNKSVPWIKSEPNGSRGPKTTSEPCTRSVPWIRSEPDTVSAPRQQSEPGIRSVPEPVSEPVNARAPRSAERAIECESPKIRERANESESPIGHE